MQVQSTHTDDRDTAKGVSNHDLVTLIADPNDPVLSSEIAAKIGNVLGSSNIIWLGEDIACDIPIEDPSAFPSGGLEKLIRSGLDNLPIDIVVHQSQTRRKKALIADMDSTMIEQECIDELAEMAGALDQVAMITKRAMNGEIEFETSLRQRMALLKGLDIAIIDKVMEERITYTPGGKTLISTMKNNGAWCALVSGGFTAFTSRVALEIGFDEHHANILLENNGKLAGKVAEPILGRQAKVVELNKIAVAHNLQVDDFIAVGDGANDLGMLESAGTGVALHAKPAVAEQADIRIDHGDLTALLYIQGYKRNEFAP